MEGFWCRAAGPGAGDSSNLFGEQAVQNEQEENKEYEQSANMKMEVNRLGRWVVVVECDRRLQEGEERRVKAKEDIES